MRYAFGDVILVPFPFTDQSTTKQRPAVVISSNRYNTERPNDGTRCVPYLTSLLRIMQAGS